MAVTPTFTRVPPRKSPDVSKDTTGRRILYASDSLAASVAEASNLLHFEVNVEFKPEDIERLQTLVSTKKNPIHARKGDKNGPPPFSYAIEAALIEVINARLSHEIGELTFAYRGMLRESFARGPRPELQTALNRARLQEKILAGTTMADQSEACVLLGMSDTNPSATMKRKEDKGEILRFTIDGRAAYPLFQFDVESRRIFPAIAKLITLKPESWSDFRLLHWLTRPHLDFGATPAEVLGTNEEGVISAFKREIEPAVHG